MCLLDKKKKAPRKGWKLKRLKLRLKHHLLRCAYPFIGLLALLWFLIRVIPKPSRATYPCQRVAFPIASSFVIYLIGLFGAATALKKARSRFRRAHYFLALGSFFIGIVILFGMLNYNPEDAKGAFIPADASNTPMGRAKGQYPGRVVWVHDPNATSWDGSSNYWWDNDHSDPTVIESMLSKAVCWVTQEQKEEKAWDSLFRYYNKTHDKGDIGYSDGERIVIKPNHNNQLSHDNRTGVPDSPPALYVALLKQLVYKAGVDPNCITISEPSRYIDDKTYNACSALFPQVRYEETNYYNLEDNPGTAGRHMAEPVPDMIKWSSPNPGTGQPIANYPVPRSFIEADYVINLARMQGHGSAGVSLCGKNWYGCFCLSPEYDSTIHSGNVLHDLIYSPSYDVYNPIVDLMGHQYLGAKTLLNVLDGLWGFNSNWKGDPTPFPGPPFNGDYPSSILVSQDPVAIDSVALDILADQLDLKGIAIDAYLHEAALADNPPSGVFYDPEGDGTRLASLGVHEHWNNSVDKQYSRNLGTGDGIELIYIGPDSSYPALSGDIDKDGCVGILDLLRFTNAWDSNPSTATWDSACDIAPAGGDQCINLRDFAQISKNWNTAADYDLRADFNFDHKVSLIDLTIFSNAWLATKGSQGWNEQCDLETEMSRDIINLFDFVIFSTQWAD